MFNILIYCAVIIIPIVIIWSFLRGKNSKYLFDSIINDNNSKEAFNNVKIAKIKGVIGEIITCIFIALGMLLLLLVLSKLGELFVEYWTPEKKFENSNNNKIIEYFNPSFLYGVLVL